MNYQEFKLIDFVLDESFQKWVRQPTPETDDFWNKWLDKNPDKKKTVERAKVILQSLDYQKTNLTENDKTNLLTKIRAKIKADELTDELKIHGAEIPDDHVDETLIYSLPARKKTNPFKIPVAAAVFLILTFTGYWVLFQEQEMIVHKTTYGETNHLSLPDGSQVMLNANSTISYQSDWDNHSDRKVILIGEAFFTIQHKPNDQKFIVQSNNIEVEVLGTTFNVNNRRGKSQVVLQSGKVKLNLKQKDGGKAIESVDMLLMKPGDLVEVSDNDRKITKKVVNPKDYSSWTADVLIFNKMPLNEVFELIQDNYGYNVMVLEEGIEQRLFTAEIASGDLDLIIAFLSKSFNLDITKHGNELRVRKNK